MKAYFAHSIRSYNTNDEQKCVTHLKHLGYTIVNPKDFSLTHIYSGRGKMNYCLKQLRQCDIVICREYKHRIGKGVFEEISVAQLNNIPVRVLRRAMGHWNLKDVIGLEYVDMNNWKVNYGKIIADKHHEDARKGKAF